jgi:FKBP12-rapamycin complex-associated protein
VSPHDVGTSAASNLQDILRLLTLWFSHGAAPDVEAALAEGFGHVSIETWLVVIPQVIARIHTSSLPVRRLIHSLLVRIGRHHPQALMYPLLVACKSQSPSRRAAAQGVVDAVRQHSATLVEQAQLVSQELIRMAILWHEMWHEALEEASRLYFGESNVEGMLSTLLPLHDMMRRQGPTTLKEIAFVQVGGVAVGVMGVAVGVGGRGGWPGAGEVLRVWGCGA